MKTCSVCGDPKPLMEFHVNTRNKDGRQPLCKKCAKARKDAWYSKNKIVALSRNLQQKLRLKAWFEDIKKTLTCNRCPENYPACLDFHHKNPNEKDFSLGGACWTRSKREILLELEKCEVLCANCHRKEEDLRRHTVSTT